MAPEVEDLYGTFKSYRLGTDFTGCDCCVTPEDLAKLSGPIRDLTFDDLERYSRKALSTWGTVHHYKHFLPRLFELTIEYRDDFMDLAVVFGKLKSSHFDSWPLREQTSVDRFFDFYWNYQLGTPIHGTFEDTADTVLCAIASGLTSIQRFLDRWLELRNPNAKRHLAAFILLNETSLLKKGQLFNAFWDATDQPHAEVLAWLQSDKIASYFDGPDDPALHDEDFAYAWPQLTAIRSALPEF